MTREKDEESTPKVGKTYTGYTSQADKESLPPIVLVEIQGETFWVHLDTGSRRDFISSDAVKKHGLQPIRYKTKHILTVNPIRTKVFSECVSVGECFVPLPSPPPVYSFACKPRVIKFGTQLKMGKTYYKKQY